MNAWWDQNDSLCQPTTNISLNFASSPVSCHVVFILLQVCVWKKKYVFSSQVSPSAGVCFALGEEVGWRFSQGNAPLKKASLPPAPLSLVHAAICMYITDAEMHPLEGLLNSQPFFFSSHSAASPLSHPDIFAGSLLSGNI